jgi:hypothetical protein
MRLSSEEMLPTDRVRRKCAGVRPSFLGLLYLSRRGKAEGEAL